jgi:hypothetical protein
MTELYQDILTLINTSMLHFFLKRGVSKSNLPRKGELGELVSNSKHIIQKKYRPAGSDSPNSPVWELVKNRSEVKGS